MSMKWNEYGADSLKVGLINFLLENCRDYFWEVHYQGFFGRWAAIHNSNFSRLNKVPKLKSGGTLRLIALSAKKRAIVLANGTPWDGSPHFEIIESIKDDLVPDKMRWPRAENFDYQSIDWKNWISFISRLAIDNHMLDWHPDRQPSDWTKLLMMQFAHLIPLNDRTALLKAYREHGF